MFKILVSLLFWLPGQFDVSTAPTQPPCDCPTVSNVQKTGQTSSSIAFSWSAPLEATQFKTWWVRQEDQERSGDFFTSGAAWNFTGLEPGHYVFYFTTICGSTTSGWIGVEDVIIF